MLTVTLTAAFFSLGLGWVLGSGDLRRPCRPSASCQNTSSLHVRQCNFSAVKNQGLGLHHFPRESPHFPTSVQHIRLNTCKNLL